MRLEIEQPPRCVDAYNHTRCPRSFKKWIIWADKMTKAGYKQKECPYCGRLMIWYDPKKKKSNASIKSNY